MGDPAAPAGNILAFALSPIAVAPLMGGGSQASLCSQLAYLDEYAAKPSGVVAHVIGFVFGAAFVWPLRGTGHDRQIAHPRWRPYADR